jgi:hypothetical protein
MERQSNIIVTNTVDAGNLARELSSFPKDHSAEYNVIQFDVTTLHSNQFLVSFLCQPKKPQNVKSKKAASKKGKSRK